jgi:hypothetical protein
LMLSIEDADFLLQHDPDGTLRQAVMKISYWHDQSCLVETYSDSWTRIYEFECKGSKS